MYSLITHKIKAILLWIFFFCLLFCFNIFAASSSMNWSQSSSSTGTTSAKSSITLSKAMDLDNVKVSFTQDDIKYYFEITANSSIVVSCDDYYLNCHPSPLLYKSENFGNNMLIEESTKAPYASCNSGQFYTTSNVQINGTTVSKQENRYRLSGGYYYDDGSTDVESGDKYFIPNTMRPYVMSNNENFRYASKYPVMGTNNGDGVELLKDDSKSEFSPIDDSTNYNYDANMNIKISIEKDLIDDYRYLCFAEAFVEITYKSEANLAGAYNGISYCSNTIDLKDYIDCDHLWKYEIKDKTNHKMVCDKCKWEKDESHNYKYEYDSLKNNLCICGFNKNVNHHFVYDSDKVDDKTVKLTASSSCTTYANPTKTGYVFNNYEQYYKYFDDMTNPVFSTTATKLTNTLMGTITTLPTMTDRFSQIFIAKYDPIKYSVVFKANSNLGFNVSLTGISNLNNISYDTEHDVPTVSYTGYIFKGWSLTSGSSAVNIKTTDKIKNLTETNAKTINLYPVFGKNKYTFKFATQSNISKINITQNIANLVCEYGTKYNLPNNIEIAGYTFKGWTLTKGSSTINFDPKAEIYNYTSINNKEYILYPVYNPIKYNVIFNKNCNLGFDISLSGINNLTNIEYDKDYNVPIASCTGYTFKGWSLTSGASTIDIVITTKIKNLTTTDKKIINLYPVFDKNKYIFKYATESNIDKIVITNMIEDLVCEYDIKYNLSNNIKVKGYNFIGWSLFRKSDKVDFDSNDEIFNYTDVSNEIITIYPIYEPIKYVFKFSNENSKKLTVNGTIDDEEFVYDDVPKKINKNIDVTGYKFVGWSLDATSGNIDFTPQQEISNFTTIDNKEIIVYPVYSPMKYVFKFSKENNVKKVLPETISDLLCEVDKKYNLPNNTIIEGYNFKGWTLTKGSDRVDFNPNAEIYNYQIDLLYDDMPVTLYPVYEPIKYTFKFSNDNVNDIMINEHIEDEEFIYDDREKALNDAVSVRGYDFVGWSLNNTSKIDFKPKQKIFNYTCVDNKEIVLHPVYEPLKINIVYDTNLGSFNEGNSLATISYIVNEMKDFDYPSINPNEKYNKWGELYKSDYLEFSGYKLNNKVFNNFDEFKEYILDRKVQNDNIVLVYNGEVKTKHYKVEHSDEDSDNDYVDFNKGPLKPAAQKIIYNTNELESENLNNSLNNTIDNTLAYIYVDESIYNTITSAKKVDKKDKEVVEEESEENEQDDKDKTEDREEIKATLSVANKWNNDKKSENISKMEMLLMIIRENKMRFIIMSSLLLIVLAAYEIIVFKSYKNRKKV